MKPYYSDDAVTLYNADCRDVLPTLSGVNLVVADPPYNGVLAEDWDNQWDSDADFLAWLDGIVASLASIITDNGTVYLFSSPRLAARIEVQSSRHLRIINSAVWDKADGRKGAAGSGVEVGALRAYWPANTERVLVAEKLVNGAYAEADDKAKEASGYWTACEAGKRGVIGEYLRAEFSRAKVTNKQVAALFPSKTGGMTGCVSNWLVMGQFDVSNRPRSRDQFCSMLGICSLNCAVSSCYTAGRSLAPSHLWFGANPLGNTNARPRGAIGRCVEQDLSSAPCSSAWIEHWIRSQRPGVQLTPRGQYTDSISLKEHRAYRLGALSISNSGAGIMATRNAYRKCRASQQALPYFPLSSLGNEPRFLSVPFSISCSIPRSISRCATAETSEPNRCVCSRSVKYSQTPAVRVTCRPSVLIWFGLRPATGAPFEYHYNGIQMDGAQGGKVTGGLALQQLRKVFATPNAIGEASGHCWCRVNTLCSLRERREWLAVVIGHEVQRDCMAMVLQFLRETVGQARETTHRHTHREVGALDVGRVDVLRVRVAEDILGFGPNADGGTVLAPTACRRAVCNDAIDFPKLRVIHALGRERTRHSRLVEVCAVCRELNATSEPSANVAHEVHRASCVARCNGPRRHQFGIRVDGDPRPRVTPIRRKLLAGARVLLFRSDEGPNLIDLDSLALQFNVARTLVGVTHNTNVSDQREDGSFGRTANAARSADAVAVHKSADDLRSAFQTQSVHGYKYA